MQQRGRQRHIPAFGEWNQQCEELPITQYFELAMLQAGRYYHEVRSAMEKQAGSKRQQGAPVADGRPRRPRVVRAVDEDLYQVPSDLLRKKGKGKKKHVRSLWMGCVGLNCVA